MVTLPKLSLTSVGAVLMSLGAVAPVTAASFYSVTELPFNPSSLNDQGQVVGQHYLWNNGIITDLNTLPGFDGNLNTRANAINNNGKIVGGPAVVSGALGSQDNAFITDGTAITYLDKSSTCNSYFCSDASFGIDINDTGQVLLARNYYDYSVQFNNFIISNRGTTTSLGIDGPVAALNNASQIAGSTISRGRSGTGRGVLVTNGTRTELISSGYCSIFGYVFMYSSGSPCVSSQTVFTTDLNDLGQVVGVGPVKRELNAPVHALLWNDPQNNNIGTDLGTFGGISSQANGINNTTQVIGFSDTASGTQDAFLWQDGTLFDLNNLIDSRLGWQLSSAVKINNEGQIIGTGYFNGQPSGFLLTPAFISIPEPNLVFGLSCFGAFGLGSWRKREQQKKK